MANHLISDKRFNPFFWTQFLGAFNDNLLKFAVTLAVTYNPGLRGDWSAGVLINLIAAVFILPFFLLSGTSGQIADKLDKARVMRLAKWLEPPVVLLTALGFVLNSVPVLILAVFLLGAQSTFFGPAKYAYLPEQMRPSELVLANAMVQSGTFVAILLGTIAAGSLMSQNTSVLVVLGVCAVGFALALVGLWKAYQIPATPARDSNLVVNWNVFSETWRNIRYAHSQAAVWPVLLGISWLWFVGATYLTQFPLLAQNVFNASPGVATALLFAFTVGLALGAFLCERWSRKRVELGLVPIGLFVMVGAGVGLHFLLHGYAAQPVQLDLFAFFVQAKNWLVVGLFVVISVGVGLYSVPLYASMQVYSPLGSRSRVVASNNIINSFFMVLSAAVAVLVLLATKGKVVWVFTVVTGLNVAVIALWWFTQPFVRLRLHLLLKVPQRQLPGIHDLDAFSQPGGKLLVFPSLLHENFKLRMAAVPWPMTVVLSGKLPESGFASFLRKHDFVRDYTKLSEIDTQKELMREIASHMNKGKVIAIDKAMYELLRKQYRLDDMPTVLAGKGVQMRVLEFKEEAASVGEAFPVIWRLVPDSGAPG